LFFFPLKNKLKRYNIWRRGDKGKLLESLQNIHLNNLFYKIIQPEHSENERIFNCLSGTPSSVLLETTLVILIMALLNYLTELPYELTSFFLIEGALLEILSTFLHYLQELPTFVFLFTLLLYNFLPHLIFMEWNGYRFRNLF